MALPDNAALGLLGLLAIFGFVVFIPCVIGVLPRLTQAGREYSAAPLRKWLIGPFEEKLGDAVRGLCVLAAAVVGACLVTGCSSPAPTAADFCQTLAQQKAQYLSSYGNISGGNALEDLAKAISAVGQWVPIFEALQQNSPPAIEPQVANIVDSLKQEQQQVANEGSDPLGALVGGLMTGLESSGSWQQVSNYISANCGSGGTS